MRRYSPRLFKDRVTFAAHAYGRAARGGSRVTGDDAVGPRLPAYVEMLVGSPQPTEAAEARPLNSVHWRIFLQDDPGAGLGTDPATGLPRRLAPDDLAYCELGRADGTFLPAFLVQLNGMTPSQPPLWCVEGDQVGNAVVDVPVQGRALLLETGGALLLETGGELLLG